MSWSWRTKPRSILRTIQWFKEFGKLQNENWNEESLSDASKFDGKKVHPIRRTYIYNAHSGEDTYMSSLSFSQYLSGKCDIKETESNGRNDKTTYEFFGFGYVDGEGLIRVTRVGQKIIDGTFDSEDFLKQLLKLQFPNAQFGTPGAFEKDDYVFPLEVVTKALDELGYLNRSELVLTFGCQNRKTIPTTISAIKKFREEYDSLPNKNDTAKVRLLCEKTYRNAYGRLENKIDSFYDYAESLCRCLIYTGIFQTSGRSIATKLRVPDYSKLKFKMLLSSYKFEKKAFSNLAEYMAWYGATDSVSLPWENKESRRKIVDEKLDYIIEMRNEHSDGTPADVEITKSIDDQIEHFKIELKEKSNSYSGLKDIENEIASFITGIREREFVDHVSQTEEARKEILEKYDEIMDAIDMSALWLEVNTWKSLLAIKGKKRVVRNFKIEEDLTPKSFAPGIGNTPDMEMYSDDYVVIPEVSLMTGVQQWEHEASSVIDHVLSFVNKCQGKKVRGLFISSSLNIRTKWQFFILNKESWVSKPVPVIPMTINQYKSIITIFYKYNLDVNEFGNLLDEIHKIALDSNNFENWFEASNLFLNKWSDSFASIS